MFDNHVKPNWDKRTVLDAEDLVEAKKMYDSLKDREFHQYYNLFDVKRRDMNEVHWSELEGLTKVSETLGVKQMIGVPYFLLYYPGSFTRLHTDNDSGTTVVTLIESSDDLIGGETLIMDTYGPRPRAGHKEAKRHEQETGTPPYGSDIIPRVVPMERGESLVYGPDLNHGVAQVDQGTRLVLITWWKERCLN